MSGGYHKAALYAATQRIGTARGALFYRMHGDGSLREDGCDFLSDRQKRIVKGADRKLERANDLIRHASEQLNTVELDFN